MEFLSEWDMGEGILGLLMVEDGLPSLTDGKTVSQNCICNGDVYIKLS